MKMYYQNKYRMYGTVLEYLQSNSAIVSLLEGLNISVVTFATIMSDLAGEMTKVSAEYKGITLNKMTARLLLEKDTLGIANATMAFANDVDDNELFESVKGSESDLRKASEQKLIDRCKNVHDIALEHLSDLEPWGITETILETQAINLEAFKALRVKKRQKQTAKSTSLTVSYGLFKKAEKLLRRTIDKAVFSLELRQPTFVRNYKKNRLTLNLGHTYTTFKGIAKVKNTEVVLSNVELEFLNSKGEIFTNSTDEKGNYRERINPDVYKITAKHPNMLPFVIEGVKILPGEMKIENLELVPKV